MHVATKPWSSPGSNLSTRRWCWVCFCSESREALVEAERSLLQEVLALLEGACPALEERSLLVDALKQLDELFLLVVVGEFNSGKSSVRPLCHPSASCIMSGVIINTSHASHQTCVAGNSHPDCPHVNRGSSADLSHVPGSSVLPALGESCLSVQYTVLTPRS